MYISEHFLDTMKIRLTSADLSGAICGLTDRHILIQDFVYEDEIRCSFCVRRKDVPDIIALCQNRGEQIEILGLYGIFRHFRNLIKRPVLIAGLLITLFLTLWLPTRTLFIFVEGNHQIPTRYILEKAALCGIKMGANTRQIRSEKVKNGLLQLIDGLQWAGVNTDGCIVTICVREKTMSFNSDQTNDISSLVALRDGVISQITTQNGTPACKPGDVVTQGQVLISGYTDCGLHIQATKAKGDVFAYTQRDLEVVTPVNCLKKTDVGYEQEKFSLIIGKKRINFYKGSGISLPGCDKITKVYQLKLAGVFELPISLVATQITDRITQDHAQEMASLSEMASRFSIRYLHSQMIAGRILNKTEYSSQQPDRLIYSAVYDCCEMIAISRKEETIGTYE